MAADAFVLLEQLRQLVDDAGERYPGVIGSLRAWLADDSSEVNWDAILFAAGAAGQVRWSEVITVLESVERWAVDALTGTESGPEPPIVRRLRGLAGSLADMVVDEILASDGARSAAVAAKVDAMVMPLFDRLSRVYIETVLGSNAPDDSREPDA